MEHNLLVQTSTLELFFNITNCASGLEIKKKERTLPILDAWQGGYPLPDVQNTSNTMSLAGFGRPCSRQR